eukprot:5503644-Pyramimonas_sp.AAC.1
MLLDGPRRGKHAHVRAMPSPCARRALTDPWQTTPMRGVALASPSLPPATRVPGRGGGDVAEGDGVC